MDFLVYENQIMSLVKRKVLDSLIAVTRRHVSNLKIVLVYFHKWLKQLGSLIELV